MRIVNKTNEYQTVTQTKTAMQAVTHCYIHTHVIIDQEQYM